MAFVVFDGAGPIPPAPLPTLALAVPSGEGDVIRSLLSLSLNTNDADVGSVLAGDALSGWEGGAGDFRVEEVDGMDSVVGGRVEVGEEVDIEDTVSGVSNSTGFVRGVACTLVINFALKQ